MIKAILFDVFGTLLDMSSVKATEEGRAELRAYGDHLRKFQETGVYEPLTLPESWSKLPVFPDVPDGIRRLKKKYVVISFSNGPLELTHEALENSGIILHEGIGVHNAKAFKPIPWIYPWACGWVDYCPSDCMMVTANRDFGDLEGAAACGMAAQLIRGESDVPDLIALAEKLGC